MQRRMVGKIVGVVGEYDRGKKDANGCAVRSLAIALGIPYYDAFEYFRDCRREKRGGKLSGVSTSQWRKMLEDLIGKKFFRPFSRKDKNNVNYMSLGQFLQVYDKGTYIVGLSCHAMAVIDGVCYDWCRHGKNAIVLEAIEVKK